MPELINPHSPFPGSLRVQTTPAVMTLSSTMKDIELVNVERHNAALLGYPHTAQPAEMTVLRFAHAFHIWCGNDDADSGYGREYITWPMAVVWSNMLNLDLGRLDGGCLSSWVSAKLTKLGIDPDTGKFT